MSRVNLVGDYVYVIIRCDNGESLGTFETKGLANQHILENYIEPQGVRSYERKCILPCSVYIKRVKNPVKRQVSLYKPKGDLVFTKALPKAAQFLRISIEELERWLVNKYADSGLFINWYVLEE